jgi:glycosyltransferase involved in cell wall biosynthesis
VTWLVHQHRQAYDLWGGPYGDLHTTPEGPRVRDLIHQMDATGLGESRALFTISGNVAARLARFTGLNGTPLYPPPKDDGRYQRGAFGDYIFTAVRLETIKRLDLLIRAVACIPRLCCLIAGNGPDRPRLEALIDELGVGDRVKLMGFVSDAEMVELYANCRAVYYAPYDEDYGYVTVEAFKSGKPVVTCNDAGGVLEFVEHGVTGWVTAPEPDAIAAALDEAATSEESCRAYGEAGAQRVAGITWDATVAALLGGR